MSLDVMLVLFQLVVLIFAFSVHECAHAYAAFRLGDPTAYMMGRVTLNPSKHIDPWGSVVMPLLALLSGWPLIGWAKPCPVTLRNFRKIKRDDIITTAAGPASNLAMAVIALIGLILLKHTLGERAVYTAVAMTYSGLRDQISTANLPPLFPLALFLYYGILTNLLLFAFNLIPIPPLDGSRILKYFLPYKVEQLYERIGGYGIILIFFIARPLMAPVYGPLMAVFDGALNRL